MKTVSKILKEGLESHFSTKGIQEYRSQSEEQKSGEKEE